MYRAVPLVAMLAATASFLLPPAPGQTWKGPGTDWNTASNWSPSTVPNSATADVTFGNTGVGSVNISTSVQARSLTFNTNVGSYNLTTAAGQTLSGVQTITNASPGAHTINLANVSTGSLLFPAGSGLTITSATQGNLTFAAGTVIGTTGSSSGITVTGGGLTQVGGSFASGANQVVGGLTKNGVGTLIITGDGSNLNGPVTLNAGITQWDYTGTAPGKLGSGALTLAGGELDLFGNVPFTVLQTVQGGTAVNAGHSIITNMSSGGVLTLNLNAISRTAPGTLDVFPQNTTGVATTTGVTNGILGGWVTANNGAGWATESGSNIVVLANGSSGSFGSGINTDIASSTSIGVTTTNSIRFTAAATLTLTGTLTLDSGGVLAPAVASNPTITGSFLATNSPSGELFVHVYGSSNSLTINSTISASGGLTKTGPGTLVWGGNSSFLSGPVNINKGGVTFTSTATLLALTAVNFNDRTNGQTLRFSLGDGVNASLGAAIGLGTTTISDTSPNSRITLAGVLSSPAGITTPLLISNSFGTGGINLTNANTFTGDINLGAGFLGVASDASLGNATNNLFLGSGATSGGLEFLTSGTTLAHNITLSSASRVVVNAANNVAISGVISGSGALFVKDGTGTLALSGSNTNDGGQQINAGTLSVSALANLGTAGSVIIAGGALSATGSFTLPAARTVLLGPAGAIGTGGIDVAAGQTFTVAGPVTDNGGGSGALLKTGAGTLILSYAANSYTGGTTVSAGTLQVSSDVLLGSAGTPVTVGPLGTLLYSGSTATTRTFTLNNGTLTVAAGQTLTLNAATVGGGFLHGPGTVAVTGGTIFSGTSASVNAVINQTGAGSFANFSNSGSLTVASEPAITSTFSTFTNQGSGSITIAAGGQVKAADFQTYGTLTIAPVAGAPATQLTNNGTTPLYFNGGSRTFLSIPQNAGLFDAGIDLHGQNAVVAGGLFVNNGFVDDSAGSHVIIADFGSLVKGAGFYQNSVQTINGGKFQSGNSPGVSAFGCFVFGPGGVSNYVLAIDDATGVAGPSPDAAGRVSGWGLVKAVQRSMGVVTTPGDFAWTADAAHPLTVHLDTLVNPTTVGTDVAGPMADFDPTKPYSWLAAQWSGTYRGPGDATGLNASTVFDTSSFQNPIQGTFGWSLDSSGQSLSLTYVPGAVPEPGTLAFTGLVAAAMVWRLRRRGVARSLDGRAER
jgi:autotransporter-associated beta strand protein